MAAKRVLKWGLLFVLGSLLGFGFFRGIDRTQPEHFWKSAQTALAIGNTADAKLYLQNVVRAQPEHGPAHRALAQLLVDEAAAAGRPKTYAELPTAARHLSEAARYLPTDVGLQRQVLKLHLAARRIDDAYEVARRIQRKAPYDLDVLTAYARHAALTYVDAEKEMKQLLDRSQSYQARLTRAELDAATKNRAHFQQTIQEATAQALTATLAELDALPKSEFDALTSLLLAGVREADDAETTALRVDEALQICEKLTLSGAGKKSHDAQLAPPARLLEWAVILRKNLAAPTAFLFGDRRHKTIPSSGRHFAAAASVATHVILLAEEKSSSSTELANRVEMIHQAAIAVEKANPFTLRYAALAALKRGDVSRALERIDLGIAAARKNAEKNEELELHLMAGRILVAARSPAAKSHLDALLAEADPNAVAWGHLLTGRFELSQGKAESALKHFGEARRRIGYRPDIREGFIDAYAALNRWEAALEELAGLAADNPAPAGTPDEQVAAAAAARDRYVALRCLQAYWGQQAWDRAAKTIDALAARQPNAESIKAVLGGLLHLAAKRPEQAVAVSRAAREAQPQDFSLALNELRVLLGADRGADAERLAEEHARTQTDVRRLITLAQTLTTGSRTEAARRLGRRALTAAAGDDDKLLARAYLGDAAFVRWRKMQDRAALVEAREHYTAMLAIQPRNFLAGNNLAWLLAVDFDEPQEALRIVDQVRGEIAAEKLPVVYLDTLAVVYRKAGRPGQAIEVLRPALLRDPQRSALHYQLGLALLDNGQEAAGRGELETALALGLKGDEAVQTRQILKTPKD